jgi:hypothetical protein
VTQGPGGPATTTMSRQLDPAPKGPPAIGVTTAVVGSHVARLTVAVLRDDAEFVVVACSGILARTMPKHSTHILELARRGAEHRYRELKAELKALEKVFAHLHFGSAVSPALPGAAGGVTFRRRRRMSAADRKAISERMKKSWAARRKAKRARRK